MSSIYSLSGELGWLPEGTDLNLIAGHSHLYSRPSYCCHFFLFFSKPLTHWKTWRVCTGLLFFCFPSPGTLKIPIGFSATHVALGHTLPPSARLFHGFQSSVHEYETGSSFHCFSHSDPVQCSRQNLNKSLVSWLNHWLQPALTWRCGRQGNEREPESLNDA